MNTNNLPDYELESLVRQTSSKTSHSPNIFLSPADDQAVFLAEMVRRMGTVTRVVRLVARILFLTRSMEKN